MNAEIQAEFETFTTAEREVFTALLLIFAEQKKSLEQAERDATAAVLEHRRMTKEPEFTPSEIAEIRKSALGEVAQGVKPGVAERQVWAAALVFKKRAKG